ncbi:MAG: MBL fold metallo-hydrolase [Lachnospiraceae bacterium]|nr:MBL fold metallo-hydrolase [Lachnospiraceae bacterium]
MSDQALDLQHVYGNTYCINFRRRGEQPVTVGVYKLSEKEIVLLDTGFSWTGEEIMRYMEAEGLSIAAIIHSHLHIDHVSGDAVIFSASKNRPVLYGPTRAVPEFRRHYTNEFVKSDADPFNNRDLRDYLDSLDILEQEMHSTDGGASVTVGGKEFTLFDTVGHSQDHQSAITPDGVLYLGDSVMYGSVLQYARAPYCYNMLKDIETKRELAKMSFLACIAAHEGWFTGDMLPEVIERNLDISRRILNKVADLEESEPGKDVIEDTLRLIDSIGLSKYRNTSWIVDTINEYFNYYYSNHTRKLPGD